MDFKLNPLECFAIQEILSELKEHFKHQHGIIASKSEITLSGPTDLSELSPNQSEASTKSDTSGCDNGFIKIKNDLEFILQIIDETTAELETDHDFSTLRNAVLLDGEKDENQINSIPEGTINRIDKQIVKQLEKELTDLEESCRTRNRTQLSLINELKDQIHLAKQKGKEDCHFAEVWLKSRNDFESGVKQKDQILRIKSQIRNMNETEERDCDSYENVMAWTKLRVATLEKKITQWKEKLVRDVKTLDEKVQERKGHIVEQELQIVTLQELINQRIQELIPWEEEKQQERQDRIQHMRRYYSCRKIQRWWRKQMVQQGLYRKKKPKPKANPKTKPKLEGKVKAKSPRNKKSS